MAEQMGVRFSPNLIEMMVRAGTKIVSHGIVARLTENPVPENYRLLNSGVDRETGDFFLVFSKGGRKTTGPVKWQVPNYEKE